MENLLSSKKKPDIKQNKSDINEISIKNSLIKAQYKRELLKTGKTLHEKTKYRLKLSNLNHLEDLYKEFPQDIAKSSWKAQC